MKINRKSFGLIWPVAKIDDFYIVCVCGCVSECLLQHNIFHSASVNEFVYQINIYERYKITTISDKGMGHHRGANKNKTKWQSMQ